MAVPAFPVNFAAVRSAAAIAAAEEAYQVRDWERSRAWARAAIYGDPRDPRAYKILGNALQSLGDLAAATAAYRRAIALDPQFAAAWANLGSVAAQQGEPATAIAHWQTALDHDPGLVALYMPLGAAWAQQGEPDRAKTCYERAIAAGSPEAITVKAWLGLGILAAQQHDYPQAKRAYERATALDPANAQGWLGLGQAWFYAEDYGQAIASYLRGLSLDPSAKQGWSNLGTCYFHQLDLDRAAACYERALAIDPEFGDAHWARANLWLLQGDYGRGLPEFEWRWRSVLPSRSLGGQVWRGEPLQGETLLVYTQCGLGDLLQFARYLPLAAQRGARVIVEVPPPMVRLTAAIPGVVQVIPKGDRLPDTDYHIACMSLPHRMTTSLETIPTAIPYLSATASDWRPEFTAAIAPDRPRLRVGIAWASGYQAIIDGERDYRTRSSDVRSFVKYLAQPGVQLHSLQVGHNGGDLEALPGFGSDRPLVHDWRDHLHDLADTAALIAALDLVICVDTSVAHLAGALGKPTWLLVPWLPNWRWLLDRADSPWYPTMRLFRQPRPGDWDAVLSEVATALQQFTRGRQSNSARIATVFLDA